MPTRLSLSAIQIEDAIERLVLDLPPADDTTIEWKAQAPSYMEAFDAWITKHRSLPGQEQFVNLYMEHNSDELNTLDEPQREAARARAVRAYPALVRKLHFKAMAMESDLFETVEPPSSDALGVDLVVQYRGQRFAITCVNRRSRRRRKPSEADRAHDDAVRDVALPFNAKKAKRVGELLLYTERDLTWLAGKFDEIIGDESPDTHQDAADSPEALDAAPAPSSDDHEDATEDSAEPEADDQTRPPAVRDDFEFGELVDWDAAFEERSGPLTPAPEEEGPSPEPLPEPPPPKDPPKKARKREDGGRDRQDVSVRDDRPPRNRASDRPSPPEPDTEPEREPASGPPHGDTPPKRAAVLTKIRRMLGR